MKKYLKYILGAVCVVILAALVLQVKIISLGDGETLVVYTPPFGTRPGGSANADLMEQLVPLYGEESDTVRYDFSCLGRAFPLGDSFISCTVTTLETSPPDSRTFTYIGCDPAGQNNSERAFILWESLSTRQ